MGEREHDRPETDNSPSRETFSEELETDLLGLIGDMENDLSLADQAVHESNRAALVERLRSVVVEASEAIHLLKREARWTRPHAANPSDPPL